MYSGAGIQDLWGANHANDSRVPDLAFSTVPGTIFTTKTTKIAEHGGFNGEDRHVGLLVAAPGVTSGKHTKPVTSMHVAATVLELLGLDWKELDAYAIEGKGPLPGLF